DVTRRSPLYNEADKRTIFYAESWAIVHYLLMEAPGGGAAIDRYLAAIARGEPGARAFRNAFLMEPSDLEEPVRKYTERRVYHSLQYSFRDPIETAARTHARTLSDAEADASLG